MLKAFKKYASKTLMIGAVFSASLMTFTSVQAQEEIWLDVRTAEEYSTGYVENSMHIPYELVGEKIAALVSDKETVIHLYCRSGNRAGKALKVLHEMGYTNAHNDGGISDLHHKAVIIEPK